MTLFFHRPSYVRRIIRTRDWARLAVVAAFAALALLIAWGSWAGFSRAFRFFQADAYFGEALSAYALEATFLAVTLLFALSGLAIGYWTLLSSGENRFLAAFPVSASRLLFVRFIESFASASWPIILIGVPAVAAYATAYGVGFGRVILFWVAYAGVLVALHAVALAADALLATFARRFGRTLAGIAGVALGVALIAGIGSALVPRNLSGIFYAESFADRTAKANLILARFTASPADASVRLLLGHDAATMPAALWLLAALSALALGRGVAHGPYRRLLAYAAEGAPPRARHAHTHAWSPRLAGIPSLLMEKDVLLFFRSGRELARGGALLVLLALYLAIAGRIAVHSIGAEAEVIERIRIAMFVITGYFATTLALRFLFPLMSLEGRSAWVVFASPVPRTKVLLAKLLPALAALVLALLPLILVSGNILDTARPGASGDFAALALLGGLALGSFAFAVGVLWPNFRDRDPDQLTTTLPGLGATALSLIFVALGAQLIHAGHAEWFVGVSLALGILPLLAAFRRIQRLDAAL